MSKRRCYAKNYGEEKIIDLVKYSRAKRKQLRTGTDDIPVNELRLSQIVAEHHNQHSVYYDRLQTSIPGIETKRMMSMSKPNGCEATLTSYAWQIKGANKPDKELVCNQERLRKYGDLGV